MGHKVVNTLLALRSKCALTDEEIRQHTPLSPAEYKGILSLAPGDALSAASFSERMGLSASRGSRVIEKMIGRGYLRRETRTEDRRAVTISLAPKGMRLRERIDDLMEECEKKIRGRLSATELASVQEAMKTLLGAL
jgi:DNA-binding MarR family transcriptional regulator